MLRSSKTELLTNLRTKRQPGETSRSLWWNPVEKRKGIATRKQKGGNLSEEVVQAPKKQEVPLYQSWQPSRLKTGIKNRPIGKKVFVR
jgi:hypothetical protein